MFNFFKYKENVFMKIEQIQKLISEKRLAGYRGKNNSLEACLKRYQYNIQLSKEFYPLLHILEVGLRNSIYEAWSKKLGRNWILEEQTVFREQESDKISKARGQLNKQNRPIETGRIIAELNFGFWTSLFHTSYETHNRGIIKDIFPFSAKRDRASVQIRKDIHMLRLFRNRIYHYEPIWNQKNIKICLEKIGKYICFINPDLMLEIQKQSVQVLKEIIGKQDVYKRL